MRAGKAAGVRAFGLVAAMVMAGGARSAPVTDAAVPAPRTGTIEGVLELKVTPPRRTASRYPTGGARQPSHLQTIPAVVYLKGDVPGGPPGPARPMMAQQDTSFVPAILVVQVGDTVDFPNRDPFFHNVFSYSSAARFDLGRYPEGESKTAVMTEPGMVKVYCEVHEFMRGVILVIENNFHAIVGEDGTFRLTDVPAGRHTLVAWHADLGTVETEVTVPEGGAARVTLRLE